ncbi:fumarylacetoacetate hydrolase family protein [Comamonas jiangduensis]|uniref:fumarylacetoacetate hydrolase family protein n=1 Tax=Comamonas jiangduensis TaxID=1194168 RepID=UPI0028B0AF30|nr:fumarylacetoacetate hydrolase family protein [Comamonas jiangduensis]
MKLATYKDGSRDGQLIVVSRDLRLACYATGIASRMQQVLDDWSFMAPQLQDVYTQLNAGRAKHVFAFDASQCMAPLPRSHQWLEAAAYPSHLALTQPQWPLGVTEPTMRQGAGDSLVGACDEVVLGSAAMGIDFGAGLAAVTGDVPMGASAEQALYGIRLLMLSNTFSLRQLMPSAPGYAWGNVQSWPVVGLSPVAVTVDELGDAWRGGKVHLPLHTSWNGRKVGMCDAGEDMAFHFGQLIAHAAKTRTVHAGSMVGTGVVSNVGTTTGKASSRRTDWPKGYHSIAEKRAMELQQSDVASTGYLQFGDTVRVEMKNKDGLSIFGAIEQTVVSPLGEGSSAS